MSKEKKEKTHGDTHLCVQAVGDDGKTGNVNDKPAVAIVRFNGGIKILGSNAAAQWLGMRQQEFYRIVHNILEPPPRVVSYQRKVDAIKCAYPELFG